MLIQVECGTSIESKSLAIIHDSIFDHSASLIHNRLKVWRYDVTRKGSPCIRQRCSVVAYLTANRYTFKVLDFADNFKAFETAGDGQADDLAATHAFLADLFGGFVEGGA